MTPVYFEIYDKDNCFEELTDAHYLNHVPRVGEEIDIGSRKLKVKMISHRIANQMAASVQIYCMPVQKEKD